MEIKINREIRDYKENIFFGLSLRQLIFHCWPAGWLWASIWVCGMRWGRKRSAGCASSAQRPLPLWAL